MRHGTGAAMVPAEAACIHGPIEFRLKVRLEAEPDHLDSALQNKDGNEDDFGLGGKRAERE